MDMEELKRLVETHRDSIFEDAKDNYRVGGRGLVLVHVEGNGTSVQYVPRQPLESLAHTLNLKSGDRLLSMVDTYQPDIEFVVCIMLAVKTDDGGFTDTYFGILRPLLRGE